MTVAQQQRSRVAKRQRRQRRQQHQRVAAATQKVNQNRSAPALHLKGATEFTDDQVLSDPVQVIKLFRRLAPDAYLRLIRRTTRQRERGVAGAPRMLGSWGLLFFAHIMAGNPDWQNWYHANRSSRELWTACGFWHLPAWQTLYLRFCELEDPQYVSAFTEAANEFIRIAARAVPEAFRFFHTDGTPAHSHARLEHSCPNKEYCATRKGAKPPKTYERASDETIGDERHERSAQPEPENPDAPPDRRVRKLSDEQAKQLGLDWQNSRYFTFGEHGHVMRSRDKDVGVRAYNVGTRKQKVWLGDYFLPAVNDYFWAPTAVHFFPADVQEHLGWPRLYRKLITALNEDPDNPTLKPVGVVADRAFNNKTFIGFNTHDGVASITPERKPSPTTEVRDLRGEHWDEHGPRCRYCDGPSVAEPKGPGVGFRVNGAGDPRIHYRCAVGSTKQCRDKVQTISCKKELRALLPINRRQRVFHDLLHAHSNFEGVFDSWRDRYAVAGASQASRSKRRHSIRAQELRAAAALLAEWFRICLRHGFIDGHKQRNTTQPEERQGGANRLKALQLQRRRDELDLPNIDLLQFPSTSSLPPPKPGKPPPF